MNKFCISKLYFFAIYINYFGFKIADSS